VNAFARLHAARRPQP